MKIAVIQSPLEWENPESNRNYFAAKIKSIQESVDLIILPEMFTTGFTMNPYEVAETMDGETAIWMKSIAEKSQAAVCGSVVIKENDNYFNRLLFVFPSGEIKYYNKRHLFTLAGENKIYKAGKEKLIVDYKGFRICLQVCYDLRFPVFARNKEDYDVLVYVANWPKPRINAWDILLKARAVENMSYVIGVNRIGMDANNHEYIGHSQIVDFLGNYIVEPQETEGVFVAILDKSELEETRKRLAFLNDRDNFTVSD
jgi:omega-amidase